MARKQLSWQQSLNIIGAIILIAVIVSAIFTIAVVVMFFAVARSRPTQQPPTVQTQCGPVQGSRDLFTRALSFKGIPYAAPPVGERRWQPPEPLSRKTCWKDTLQATEPPPQCAQAAPGSTAAGQEDCLYLNVYTPGPVEASSRPRPVMVWLHGGYLQWGNISDPTSAPDARLASAMDAVQVVVQYRLGGFGFLVLNALPGKGNYGIWDQLQALKWVQRNIANFGGDPKQVTIWGQGSGGTSVWALMMSPKAKGLFHRALSISPSSVLTKTLVEARRGNKDMLIQPYSIIGKRCPDVNQECLMSMNASDVALCVYPSWDVVADSMDLPTKGYFEPPLLIVDGELIPKKPFNAWKRKTGKYVDVPFMIASLAQATDVFPEPGLQIKTWNKEKLGNYVRSKLGTFSLNISEQALTLYQWVQDAEFVLTSMQSDIRANCPNNRLAQNAADALTSPVYRYVVTSQPSRPVAIGSEWSAKYAFHGWDTLAMFDMFNSLWGRGPGMTDSQFQQNLYQQLSSFIRTGKPASKDWLPYPQNTALISDDITYINEYHKEQCNFWLTNDFFQYAWMN